jgi:hypothetical protein
MEWGRQAIRAARGASDIRLEAYAHNMMATALIDGGRLNEAVRHLRKAVRAYHEAVDYAGQASANNNLGSAYQLLGMYDAALYHYELANIADKRAGDDIDAAIVHNNMAETLLLLDREDDAIDRLQQVLRTAKAEPDLADLGGWAHVTMARCFRATGRLREAARHLRIGLATLRQVGALGLLTEAMVDSAEQALAEGDVRLARRRATIAHRQSRESDSRLAAARAERVLGECSLRWATIRKENRTSSWRSGLPKGGGRARRGPDGLHPRQPFPSERPRRCRQKARPTRVSSVLAVRGNPTGGRRDESAGGGRVRVLLLVAAALALMALPGYGRVTDGDEPPVVPGELLVRYREGMAADIGSATTGATYNQALDVWRVDVEDRTVVEELTKTLLEDPAVESVRSHSTVTSTPPNRTTRLSMKHTPTMHH